ncbi:hypothetical protein G6F24_014271 [Rhizopus arrhizus]|nr:hypothetical protein G6F24_014271 [Rhizopus arrhizus]
MRCWCRCGNRRQYPRRKRRTAIPPCAWEVSAAPRSGPSDNDMLGSPTSGVQLQLAGTSMDTDDQSAMIPPRYQRLSDELAEAIHGGRLPVGRRLPSLRQMALQRRLSLNTVIAAYRQLEDAGLVIPRPTAGFEVAPRLSVPERSLRDTPSAPTAPLQQALMARVLEAQRRPGVIDLAFAGPRGRHRPWKPMRARMARRGCWHRSCAAARAWACTPTATACC